jgi:hypothetical protein
MIELVSGMPAAQVADQSWFKVQAAPVFHFD